MLTKLGFARKWRHEDLREAQQRGSGGMSKRIRGIVLAKFGFVRE